MRISVAYDDTDSYDVLMVKKGTHKHFTFQAAAKLLGLSVGTVRGLVAKGLIPSKKTPGGRSRIEESDVLAYANSLEAKSFTVTFPP